MPSANIGAEPDRNRVIVKTNTLVLFGYILTSLETFIARMLGFTGISYADIAIISSAAIAGTLISLFILIYKKEISLNLEKILFFAQLILYMGLYCLWVYNLGEMRLFALFSSLFGVIVVLSYTNILQSLMISVSTIISFILASYYAIFIGRQNGNFTQDVFYALCSIPTLVIISVIANQINNKNKEMEAAKQYLEETNDKLRRLNRELEDAQKMSRFEMELAHDIQKSLFPQQPRSTSTWDIALAFKPKYAVSGDFYDFYYEDENLRGLSIFDVSGHGVASALVTILAKPVFYRYFTLLKNEPLEKVIENANNTLKHDLTQIGMYITGIILRFTDNNLEYANAGHPDLLYKSKGAGDVEIIPGKDIQYKSIPIGLIDAVSSCKSYTFTPGPGDVLLLYTDCITESNNTEKKRYGTERLVQSLKEAPDGTAREILDYIVRQFYLFLDEKEIEDDFTVILVKKLDYTQTG